MAQASSDWLSEWERTERERRKNATEGLWPALDKAGVHMVIVGYSGYGDSGMVEDVTYTPKLESDDRDLYDAVCDFVYAHLPSGWEINEGSQGEVTIDAPSRTATFDHGDNVMSVEKNGFEVTF